MIIQLIQAKLEETYALEGIPHVEDFILPQASVDALKGKSDSESHAPQLMVQEEHEELFLGVYLGEQYANGHLDVPPQELSLGDFCEIAEEVSHFVYLSWSAQNSKPRSLLDLELQAEVDKWILTHQLRPLESKSIHTLFSDFSFRPTLTEAEKKRYVDANRFAFKFLKNRSLEKLQLDRQCKDMLRQFYRRATSLRMSDVQRL